MVKDSLHILVLTCHDLGRHLGCYGVGTVQTPHIDRLGAAGARFERAFCTSPGCSPSRAALATGRYPHSNGVMGLTHPPFNWDLGPEERHIAQILGAAGYETHLFGHQHVSTRAGRLGFDTVHGPLPALGRDVAALLTRFLEAKAPDRPLYLEVNLEEPHRPYDQGGARPDRERGVSVPAYLPQDAASHEEMAALQGAIRQADGAVGAIVQALEGAGFSRNTLLVFTADHGLAMPRAKCTLYDPGIEIALILRWPEGGVEDGRVLHPMVSNVDLLPTLLQAAGVPAPPGLQGRSLLPLLRGEPFVEREAAFAEKTYHSYYDPMRAIRTERFKYIRNFETAFEVEVPGDVQLGAIFREHVELYHAGQHPPAELYDLTEDPLERHNLAGEGQLAEAQGRLDAALWSWMAETGDPLLRGPVPSPAYVDTQRRLRQYVETTSLTDFQTSP